jgi:methionyl-tRNA formyltransferase
MKVVVVGSFYSKYLHDICKGLHEKNIKVDEVLLGSRFQRFLFKLNSLKRVIKKNGILDVFRRYQLKRNQQGSSSYLSLIDIQGLIGFDLHYFDDVNSGEVMALLSKGSEDQVVILAGSGIVDQAFLECSGGNCINGHPAWLPGYRGVDVVDWALLDCKDIGVSSHFVTPKVDAGSIIVRRQVPIIKNETYTDFRKRVNEYQAEVVVEAVKKVIANDLEGLIENDLPSSKLCYVAPAKVQQKAIQKFTKIQEHL